MAVAEILSNTWEVLSSERVSIEMYGGERAAAAYSSFTAPHRLLRFLGRKSWGAALLRLPARPEQYLVGGNFELTRRKRKKAMREGYVYRRVTASEHVAQMIAINRSSTERQGRAMQAQYVDEQAVTAFCAQVGEIEAVFDSSSRMVAYAHAPDFGDVFCFSRLLGDAQALQAGIMYLLLTETILQRIRTRQPERPLWAMYDMYWGGRPGLREFKRRLGFRPYRVQWTWRSQAPR